MAQPPEWRNDSSSALLLLPGHRGEPRVELDRRPGGACYPGLAGGRPVVDTHRRETNLCPARRREAACGQAAEAERVAQLGEPAGVATDGCHVLGDVGGERTLDSRTRPSSLAIDHDVDAGNERVPEQVRARRDVRLHRDRDSSLHLWHGRLLIAPEAGNRDDRERRDRRHRRKPEDGNETRSSGHATTAVYMRSSAQAMKPARMSSGAVEPSRIGSTPSSANPSRHLLRRSSFSRFLASASASVRRTS